MHRDLAVRNILVSDFNKIKIGDFGLARMMQGDDDFWKMDRSGKLPVRYMAPESFVKKIFTEKTDVWGFGVTIWEMMTYSEVPYQSEGIDTAEVKEFVLKGGRPRPPPVCSRLLKYCLLIVFIFSMNSSTIARRQLRTPGSSGQQ